MASRDFITGVNIVESILRTRNGAGFLTVATIAPDYYGGGFPPVQAHRLVAAAWCRVKPAMGSTKQDAVPPEVVVESLVVHDLTAELDILTACQKWLNDAPADLPIGTFYGDLFTWPTLCWRACSHATAFPIPLTSQRFDLADYTTFGFESKRLSITDCAEYMGMPKRFSTNVQDRYFAQDYESIVGFVETDLLIYSLCWLRFLLVAGALTRAQFTATGHIVMKQLHARTPMVKEYIKQFDYRKFLLLPPKKDPSRS